MGEVIGAGELHKGVKLLIDGEPWEITEFDFSKPATVEGGYTLPVPLFINEGDVIRINTEAGEYNDCTATK